MTRHLRRRAWLSEAVIIVALMLVPLLFWWRLWALDPADRAVIPEGDFTSQYYPLQLFAARELAEGRLPAWDPYLNAGQPGLADIQTGVFYPLNLLPNLVLALFGLPFSIGLLQAQIVLHFSLASLFTYLLVRHLARRAGARVAAARFAGVVAALVFTYSGYLTSFPVQQLTILETAIWLPLVLFFLDRASHCTRPLSHLILGGVAFACALLAGHPQTSMYVAYAALAYGVFVSWTSGADPERPRIPRVLRVAYITFLPLVMGLALAAVQLAPTLQFIARSTRSGLDFSAVSWGFPLAEMVHLFYPGYFGGSPQYVGILAPILAAAALFINRARREVIFWIGLGVVALLLSFGRHTFFYSFFYLFVPGFGAVRDQERIIVLFSLAVSILSGYGALVLVQPLAPSTRRGFRTFARVLGWVGVVSLSLTGLWYFGYLWGLQQGVEVNQFEGLLRHHLLLLLILGGAIVLFVLRMTGRLKRKWLMALALGLIWLNLFTVNWRFNLAEPVAGGGPFAETGTVAFLKAQPGTFRISSAGLLPGGSSAGIVYELEDITGNTPLRLDAFEQFEAKVGSWRRWQLLNVQYVLSDRELDGPGLERVYEEGETKVYRVGDPLPRAWIVYDAEIASDEEAIAILNADDYHPMETAILAPDAAPAVLPQVAGPSTSAQVLESSPGRLVLAIEPTGDGLLVVSQPFYPGWRASVDGEPVPVYRVDYLLQGVQVQAGSRRVELSYRLSPVLFIVSLAALVVCVAAIFVERLRA